MIKNGDHLNNCAVCGTKLEYYNFGSYMGDCDIAECEECDTAYCEGYLVGVWGGDVDVPKAQIEYLKQAVKTKECETFIRQQLGLTTIVNKGRGGSAYDLK